LKPKYQGVILFEKSTLPRERNKQLPRDRQLGASEWKKFHHQKNNLLTGESRKCPQGIGDNKLKAKRRRTGDEGKPFLSTGKAKGKKKKTTDGLRRGVKSGGGSPGNRGGGSFKVKNS